MTRPPSDVARLSIDTIRTLSMDAVQAANSGHPGTPMALAPAAYWLWTQALRYDPADPLWPARDRFVLSAGHASMLLYSVLHLAGVRQADVQGRVSSEPAVSLDDIRRFRQLDSRCPGHPEFGHTSGVETTTGPLGQGVANSVGMAMAQRWLAAKLNRQGYDLFDYNIYVICSDGDLMEGVGCEAASLAGHLKLSNLCWFYDANRITIDGRTDLAFTEDVAARFRAYGWHVCEVTDANDLAQYAAAHAAFLQTTDRPTLVVVRSVIGWGSPHKQDTSEAHGAPLGEEEVRLTKQAYGWPADETFRVPQPVLEHFAATVGRRGAQLRQQWNDRFVQYAKEHPNGTRLWQQIDRGELPGDWDADLPTFPADAKGVASRDSSGKVLNAIAARVPWLVGGAADLASSTKTTIKAADAGDFQAASPGGRNLHFGVREHVMGSILNGLALSKLRPFGSTFLVFSDYARPAMRLSALVGLPAIYIYTHDSIGVGEDGPTHQPVEHLAALRAIPGMTTIRPGDAGEVVEAWRTIMPMRTPATLVLTRQNLPTLDRTKFAAASGARRGAYVLADAPNGKPAAILIGTGSELGLCVSAYEQLSAAGLAVRLVSMPSWELFEAQDAAYREQVLPAGVTARVAVEAGIEQGWSKYLGPRGKFIGMKSYGASAPIGVLMKRYGFTVENVVATVREMVGKPVGQVTPPL